MIQPIKLGYNCFHPHPWQLIIHWFLTIQQYTAWITDTINNKHKYINNTLFTYLLIVCICLNSSLRIRKYNFIQAQQVSHKLSHLICTVTWHVRTSCVISYTIGQCMWKMFSAEYRGFICNTFAKFMCHVKNSCQKACKSIFCQECPCKRTIYRMVGNILNGKLTAGKK